MTTLIIVLLLLWPLFQLLRILMVARIIMGLEFRAPRVTPLLPAQIPPHVHEAATGWLKQLQAQEFTLLGGWRIVWTAEAILGEDGVVLAHPRLPIVAVIRPRDEANLSGQCWVSLRTTLQDGSEIVTTSYLPEVMIPTCSGVEIEKVATTAAVELLQRHVARINPVLASAWRCPDLASAAERERHVRTAQINDAVVLGVLTADQTGSYHYRAGAALKGAWTVIRISSRNKKEDKGLAVPASPLSPAGLAAFDLYHYRQMVAFSRGRFSLRTKAVISTVSFLIFAGVLAWQYSVTVALWLVIALVIHEGGHLVGMWMFGFRDTQLLFIPFFGGAAVGHDDKVLSPWKHIVIILLGPLPGIFLSLGMMAYASSGTAPEWLNQAALTMLVLNAFNLLPVLPLDGGQIVDFAVASRFPRARVLFLAVSAGGMMLIGLLGGGAKLLLYLGIASLIRLPTEWRLAGVRREVREEFPDGGEEEPVVTRLLEHMREPEWAKTPVSNRLQLVRGLQLVMRMPKPGIGTMVFALAGFTAPLWLGAPLALWAAVRQSDARLELARTRAEAAGLHAPAHIPPPVPAGLAPEDNAAIEYAMAVTLLQPPEEATEPGKEEEEDHAPPEPEDEEASAKVVALLRSAAQKKAFAPVPAPAGKARHTWLARFTQPQVLNQLVLAAGERLRYHEPREAIAIDCDTLRLLRLMQASPGALDWSTYQTTTASVWENVEESLATGTSPTPKQLAELREFALERPLIDYANASIPAELFGNASTSLEDLAGDEPRAAEPGSRLLMAILEMTSSMGDYRAEAYDHAVQAKDQLAAIRQGTWPEPVPLEDVHKSGSPHVAQLGDLVARQRQARAALRAMELRGTGTKELQLEALAAAPAELQHPFTRERMRLAHRGAFDVLVYKSGVDTKWDRNFKSEAVEVVWRVPAEIH